MTRINRIRYKYAMWRHGMSFLGRVKSEAVRQLVGHTKIIGWENSLPVRSLAIPAEYSPAYVKSAARLYNSLRSKINYPGLASLSITKKCNCSCSHCLAFDQQGNELSLGEWQEVIQGAMELGVFSFVVTGGEPLLRNDLPEIIQSIDPNRSSCHVYTNGWRLEEMAGSLYSAGLRRISVSVDFANEKEHDKHRDRPGLFNKVLKGIQAAQRKGMLTGISTFVTPERFENGVLEEIFKLASHLMVNEISVYDALPSGKLENNPELKKVDKAYRKKLKSFIGSWWNKKNAPGIWWYGHISSCKNLGCTGGTSMFNVSHCGEFRPCDFCRTSVGSIHNYDLEELWGKLNAYAAQKRMAKGNGCILLR